MFVSKFYPLANQQMHYGFVKFSLLFNVVLALRTGRNL